MTYMCSYKNCFNRRTPGSQKIFFRLPTDDTEQRQAWIENSGNKDLENISLNSQRLFCEDHFDEQDIRRQFNRATLRKNTIPRPWTETSKGIDAVIAVKPQPQKRRRLEETETTETYILDFEEATVEPVQGETEEVHEIIEDIVEPMTYIEVKDCDCQTDTQEMKESETQTDPIHEPVQNIPPPPPVESKVKPPKVKLDEDEFFAVNVIATVLKKLTNTQKSKAKMDILALLYQIEQEND